MATPLSVIVDDVGTDYIALDCWLPNSNNYHCFASTKGTIEEARSAIAAEDYIAGDGLHMVRLEGLEEDTLYYIYLELYTIPYLPDYATAQAKTLKSTAVTKDIVGVVRVARNGTKTIAGRVNIKTTKQANILGGVTIARAYQANIVGATHIAVANRAEISGRVRIKVATPIKLPEAWEKPDGPESLAWESSQKAPEGWSEREIVNESWSESESAPTGWSESQTEPMGWSYPMHDGT